MLKKLAVIIAICISFVFIPRFAFAEEGSESSPTPKVTTTETPIKDRMREVAEKRKETLEQIREERKEKIENLREEMKKRREEAKKEMEEAREEFQEKVNDIQDKRKKVLVQSISERLTGRNERYTNRMSEVLEKLKEILKKISEKRDALKSEGKDTSALDAAITSAEEAIEEAESAVADQAGKTYTLEIEDEETLKEKIGPVVSGFRQDLRDTHKSVVDAKQAVRKAAAELAKLRGGERLDATPTTGSASVEE